MDAASLSHEVISAPSAPRIALVRECLIRVAGALAGPFADPRIFQVASLGILLAAGVFLRDFSLLPAQIILTFAAAIVAQRISWRWNPPKSRSLRSAIITALGITLLLRTDNLMVHPIAAASAIAAKSIFRVRGKHLFNPAMLGVIVAIAALPGSWVSPGQWGQEVAYAGWFIALGAIVTRRAERGDISWGFLAMYLGAMEARDAWLGYSFAVWTHQLDNGALLLFAFFMISDPMTSPNSRRGRIAHAAVVAAIALALQFGLYAQNSLVWALFCASFAVPAWDRLFPAPKFEWNSKGGSHDSENGRANSGRTRDPRRRRHYIAA
ncbi:MAG TPA: RnfABCDGE type electron transport complex subunit D [Candidatus Binataceae bacterium]|nr:RnfABCDGE type electron transport complex subunit D [Candidatus Binataceae bacterium]